MDALNALQNLPQVLRDVERTLEQRRRERQELGSFLEGDTLFVPDAYKPSVSDLLYFILFLLMLLLL